MVSCILFSRRAHPLVTCLQKPFPGFHELLLRETCTNRFSYWSLNWLSTVNQLVCRVLHRLFISPEAGGREGEGLSFEPRWTLSGHPPALPAALRACLFFATGRIRDMFWGRGAVVMVAVEGCLFAGTGLGPEANPMSLLSWHTYIRKPWLEVSLF